MKKLLIIDDDKDIRENLKDIFELVGKKVYTAENGSEGIAMAIEHKPDIILCDIAMPELDGLQAKQLLRENKHTSSIPFIFLTARAEISSMREAMDLGADDYIVKPVHPKDVVRIVEKRLERISKFNHDTTDEKTSRKLTLEDKISLSTGKEHVFISINSIVVIDVTGDYTKVYTNEAKKILIKKTIKSWENVLPEKSFVRAHRNIIINLNYVEKIEPYFKGALVAKMKNYPEIVKFSKRYSQKVKKMLHNL